jgi:large subunit ribosomal protein L23
MARRQIMNTIVPRMSEKAFKVSSEVNTYVFTVPLDMNRTQVADAVKAQYSVDVENVSITVSKGKAVRYVRKGGRVNKGFRADIKKAYVKLPKGQTLPIFAAIEEEIKEVEKTDKTAAPEQKKRGLFNRKDQKATKTASAGTQVTRTQAKVGEK